MTNVKLKSPIWIIGDVHGKYNKLLELLDKIPKEDKICFVGDLIDRGRDSKKVVKLIRDNNYYVIKGNHEQMACEDFNFWIQEGGKIAIKSYSKKSSEDINYKEEYQNNQKLKNDIEWFKSLPIIIKFEIDNEKPLYVSHSGIELYENDEDILEKNDVDTILWNRRTMSEVDFAVNIHGHSPQKEIFVSKSQINIDTGASMSDYPLTAIRYPDLKIIQSENY